MLKEEARERKVVCRNHVDFLSFLHFLLLFLQMFWLSSSSSLYGRAVVCCVYAYIEEKKLNFKTQSSAKILDWEVKVGRSLEMENHSRWRRIHLIYTWRDEVRTVFSTHMLVNWRWKSFFRLLVIGFLYFLAEYVYACPVVSFTTRQLTKTTSVHSYMHMYPIIFTLTLFCGCNKSVI